LNHRFRSLFPDEHPFYAETQSVQFPRLLVKGNCMTDFIILPGIGGSDEAHWQSEWQRPSLASRRFSPASWDRPDLKDWTRALERAVAAAATPPVLIAHSLSCLLVAHWQKISQLAAAGAFLVAVPDPSSPVFPAVARDFSDVPRDPFRFPSMIVASINDPYGTSDYAKARAAQWGSDIHIVGALGHISSASHLGEWPEGRKLLAAFALACHHHSAVS